MNFKISQVLIIFLFSILISETFGDRMDLTRTLNSQFEYILKQKDDIELFRSVNTDCVKTFLNLIENGETLVNLPQEFVLLMSSFMKCTELDGIEYFKLLLRNFVQKENTQLTNCFKMQLKVLDPASQFVSNSYETLTENDLEFCKNNKIDHKFEKFVKLIEAAVGPLAKFTCGKITSYKELTTFYYKSYLTINEKHRELRELELKSMTKYVRDVLYQTVECIIRDIEETNLDEN